MKHIFYLLIVICQILSVNKTFGVTKRALIVAIGNYPHEGGWQQISSIKDTGYIIPTLRKQGFSEKNITVITDAQASVRGLNYAFNKLINDANAGDIVVIHFSSHGEQVEDDNSDETDGLDECIVSFDAIAPNQEGFSENMAKDGAGYFRDDALGNYVNQLRNKLGKDGDVIVFMDNCHSGTGTRGIAHIRGGKPPLVSKSFDPKKFGTDDGGVEKTSSRGDESNMATYVVFSAARAEEFDYETTDEVTNQGVGSLTYAISKAFENLDKGATYRSLFAKVQATMNDKVPSQHPVLEGTGLDRMLFGGNYVDQKPYVNIEEIVSNKEIKIQAGTMAGLDVGAKVSVYASGTNDPKNATPLARGVVKDAQNFSSTISLDGAINLSQPAAGWVFVTEPVYKVKSINVNIVAGKSRGFTQTDITTIKNGLKDLPLVSFEGQPELLLVRGVKDSIINAANGYVFATVDNAATNIAALEEKMQQYAQYKFLQELSVKEQGIGLDVKFIPVRNGKPDATMTDAIVMRGMYEFTDKDTVVLRVKNNGDKAVYINILDMQPDGIINPILPNTHAKHPIYPSDLKIEPGQERIFGDYHIFFFPPYGIEQYKIFASTKEINMEQLATSKGAAERGNFSGLEKLVKKSYGMRGSGAENVSNADGSTYDLTFRIKQR